jgi:hypothetical protein
MNLLPFLQQEIGAGFAIGSALLSEEIGLDRLLRSCEEEKYGRRKKHLHGTKIQQRKQ